VDLSSAMKAPAAARRTQEDIEAVMASTAGNPYPGFWRAFRDANV